MLKHVAINEEGYVFIFQAVRLAGIPIAIVLPSPLPAITPPFKKGFLTQLY